MNRNKAVAIFKKILNSYESMATMSFNLNKKGQSDNYEIIILSPSGVDMQELTEIAKNHNLSIKQENGEIILYTP